MYVAEIADKNLRGSLSNLINICFNLGVVFTFAASIFVTWRTLAWILTVPVFLAWIGIYLVPETPYWLAQKNRIDNALKSLSWLRNSSETLYYIACPIIKNLFCCIQHSIHGQLGMI